MVSIEAKRRASSNWQKNHPDLANAKSNRWYHNKKDKLFRIILDHYGQKCNCCDETNIKFLTVDHVTNDGDKHRSRISGQKTLKVYQDVIDSGFNDEYQILCWNCNFGRRYTENHICPHKS